jgi:hypothetical protein
LTSSRPIGPTRHQGVSCLHPGGSSCMPRVRVPTSRREEPAATTRDAVGFYSWRA